MSLRFLAVEDEAVNLQLLRATLGRADDPALRTAEVVEARTLAEARAALADASFDAILLDVRLPDGDGLTLAAELADGAGPGRPRPVIVVVTASVLPQERDAALRAGTDAFVAKPYRPAELVSVLRRVLDGRVPPG